MPHHRPNKPPHKPKPLANYRQPPAMRTTTPPLADKLPPSPHPEVIPVGKPNHSDIPLGMMLTVLLLVLAAAIYFYG